MAKPVHRISNAHSDLSEKWCIRERLHKPTVSRQYNRAVREHGKAIVREEIYNYYFDDYPYPDYDMTV